MTDAPAPTDRDPLVLAPGEGRSYPMGRLSVVFKAGGSPAGCPVGMDGTKLLIPGRSGMDHEELAATVSPA